MQTGGGGGDVTPWGSPEMSYQIQLSALSPSSRILNKEENKRTIYLLYMEKCLF